MIKYFITLLLVSTWAQGKDNLPDILVQDSKEYQRCNEFTLRYGFVIKVAEIGWYSPQCDNNTLLESSTKILRFHYHKDVKADFFKESAEEYFLLNLDNQAQQNHLLQPLQSFNDGYTDIKSGEYFQLIHKNDSTLSLYRNQDLLATTDNVELAKKYFNIWFGEKPVIKKLKNAFL